MRLSKREIRIVVGGSALAAVILLYGLVLAPALDRFHTLERKVVQTQRELQEMEKLRRQYRDQEARLAELGQRLERRGKNFSLFSFVEEQARKAGVRDKLTYVKPGAASVGGYFPEAAVELKLDGVYLKQLTAFLEGIEGPENMVRIKKLQVRTRIIGGRNLVEGILTLSTFGFPKTS